MGLYWLTFLVIAILVSKSAQGYLDQINDIYTFEKKGVDPLDILQAQEYLDPQNEVYSLEKKRVDPYYIVQAQDPLDDDNYQRIPIGYFGRSGVKDKKKYKKLKNLEATKKLKIIVKKLKSVLPPLIRILKLDEDFDED